MHAHQNITCFTYYTYLNVVLISVFYQSVLQSPSFFSYFLSNVAKKTEEKRVIS